MVTKYVILGELSKQMPHLIMYNSKWTDRTMYLWYYNGLM